METDRNPWHCWQAGSAGSHLPDIGGDEEVLHSSATPHYSVPNSDRQILGGESWLELEQLSWLISDMEDHRPEQLSWSNSDVEDHRRNAEFTSQFRVESNGNLLASSESWKDSPVAGDGGVAIDPAGPENLGMCSRATEDPLPKRNHTTVASIAQNLIPLRSQENVDGEKKTGKRHRCPNWTLQENRSFLQHMEVHKRKSPWKAISDDLKTMGFAREAKACEHHWGVLLADLKKFEKHFGSDNILRDLHFWPRVGTMSREQRSQNGLPLVFEEEWFQAMAKIVKERSKHRKSRVEYSKGRIHDAATPPSSSRRQQSRDSAASGPPSSEIFNNRVGDGDGISGLVKLLGSTDRNLTVDQTIEVMRISLEAQKLELLRQEFELERERVFQAQRNEIVPEKARRTPAPHEWNRRGRGSREATSVVTYPASECGYE